MVYPSQSAIEPSTGGDDRSVTGSDRRRTSRFDRASEPSRPFSLPTSDRDEVSALSVYRNDALEGSPHASLELGCDVVAPNEQNDTEFLAEPGELPLGAPVILSSLVVSAVGVVGFARDGDPDRMVTVAGALSAIGRRSPERTLVPVTEPHGPLEATASREETDRCPD